MNMKKKYNFICRTIAVAASLCLASVCCVPSFAEENVYIGGVSSGNNNQLTVLDDAQTVEVGTVLEVAGSTAEEEATSEPEVTATPSVTTQENTSGEDVADEGETESFSGERNGDGTGATTDFEAPMSLDVRTNLSSINGMVGLQSVPEDGESEEESGEDAQTLYVVTVPKVLNIEDLENGGTAYNEFTVKTDFLQGERMDINITKLKDSYNFIMKNQRGAGTSEIGGYAYIYPASKKGTITDTEKKSEWSYTEETVTGDTPKRVVHNMICELDLDGELHAGHWRGVVQFQVTFTPSDAGGG